MVLILIQTNARPPTTLSELRSFLNLFTYVSRFIKDFSEKTTALRELLKKKYKI